VIFPLFLPVLLVQQVQLGLCEVYFLSLLIRTATAELEETVQSASQVLREYDQLIGWAEMYDNCTFEAKKMIVAQFVKEVHVRRDYEIDIEFNVSFEEFQALYLDKEPEETQHLTGALDSFLKFCCGCLNLPA